MIQKRSVIEKIPGRDEWAGYESDVGGQQARSFWFGKSLDEVQGHFAGGQSIQRGDELLFMPRRAFQFYIFAFTQYVLPVGAFGDWDAASSFLNFLSAREKRDPGSVAQIYERLAPTIEFVAASQARFAARHDIYGDFPEKAEELKQLCATTLGQRHPDDQMLDPTDDA
jgi:hypothetical protein